MKPIVSYLRLGPWARLGATSLLLFPVYTSAARVSRSVDPTQGCQSFAACARVFEANQDSFEVARRLYETGSALPFGEAISSMRKLRERLPGAHYLLIIEAYLRWGAQPEEALEWCRRAREAFRGEGQLKGEALSVLNLATLHAELGHYDQAQRLHEELERLGEAAKDVYTQALALTGVAHYRMERHLRLGESYRALDKLPELRTLPESLQTMVLLARAGLASMLNEFASAESDYLRVLELADKRQDAYRQASCSHGLAALYEGWVRGGAEPEIKDRIQQRIEPLFKASMKQADALERVALGSYSRLRLAQRYAQTPRRRFEALALLEECLHATKQGKYRSLQGRCIIAKSAVISGEQPFAALKLARRGFAILGTSNLHSERLESWSQLMKLSWELFEPPDAYLVSDAALSVVEMLRGDQLDESARMRVFSTWTAEYQEVARKILEARSEIPDAMNKALDLLERARARTLVEAVRDSGRREPYEGDERAAQAYKKLCRTMIELLDLALNLQAGQSESGRNARIDFELNWKTQLQRLGQAVKEYRQALGLIRANRFTSSKHIRSLLQDEEALLTYVFGRGANKGEGAFALLLSRKGTQIIPMEQLDPGEISGLVKAYRGRILSPDGQDRALRQRLRAMLLEPVLARLSQGINHLTVVPDGALFTLPFHSLDSEHAYSVSASLQYWAHIRAGRRLLFDRPRGLAIVDPRLGGEGQARHGSRKAPVVRSWKNPSLDAGLPLPQTRREGRVIVEELGDGIRILQGQQANRRSFLSLWKPSWNLLHVATHASVDRRDPRKSALVLASNREESSEQSHLTGGEIEGMNFKNAMVVLSGCSTAGGASLDGEGVLSLARSFQRGGAIAVVASLWPVYDKETADFFETFYAHLAAGASVGESLHRSQVEFEQAGRAASSYSAFVVLGDASVRFETRQKLDLWWLLLAAVGVGAFACGRRRVQAKSGMVGKP